MGRRKTVREELVEELFRALFEKAAARPNGTVARWLARAMIAVIVLGILVGIALLVGMGIVLFSPGTP
ncbi:MAG: hypothetical protein OXO52_21645 [Rhodospirillales bacterium]|nr:hypothetical protein [Rhodospirillales bacterium]MDE0381434.1 hypothetical protein [Rhodospirillales bacterium]